MIIILDTNVLVSGLLVAANPPGRVLDLIRSGHVRLAVDDRVLAEYEEVLARARFHQYFTTAERNRIIGFIRAESIPVVCDEAIEGLPDASDAPFAEIALKAGLPLVTGNIKHFPSRVCRGIQVWTPREFMDAFSRRRGS